jgi:hypothetical protein
MKNIRISRGMAWSQNCSTYIHHEMVAKAYRSELGSCVAAESSWIRLGKIATGKRERGGAPETICHIFSECAGFTPSLQMML